MRISTLVLSLASAVGSPAVLAANSFIPAGGLWAVDSENTGAPGRGFQIEVENDILVFTYYGYRSDGSSAFYLAAGPIDGDTFRADLIEYAGGKPLGGPYAPAAASGTQGKVTLTFTSGKHGTVTFPGEPPMSISKFSFGYPSGPDGLLGTWIAGYTIVSTFFSNEFALATKLGVATSTGNGIVGSSDGNFVCEYQVSDVLAGSVLCAQSPAATSYPDVYAFKFSGDRGTGFGFFTYPDGTTISSAYPLQALRVATASGSNTGLNDGTPDGEAAYRTLARQDYAKSAPQNTTAKIDDVSSALPADPARDQAVRQWTTESRKLLRQGN